MKSKSDNLSARMCHLLTYIFRERLKPILQRSPQSMKRRPYYPSTLSPSLPKPSRQMGATSLQEVPVYTKKTLTIDPLVHARSRQTHRRTPQTALNNIPSLTPPPSHIPIVIITGKTPISTRTYQECTKHTASERLAPHSEEDMRPPSSILSQNSEDFASAKLSRTHGPTVFPLAHCIARLDGQVT